MHNTYIAPQDA